MKRYILVLIVLIAFLRPSYGQQREQYTNYLLNNFVINPAVGGSYSYWNLKLGYRSQWVGIDGTPRTFFASLHGPINYPDPRRRQSSIPHQGIGGYVYWDQTGPLSYKALFGSYSIHRKVNKKLTASAGAFLGIKEFRINEEELRFVQSPTDPLFEDGFNAVMTPDLNLGLFLYSEHFFAGISGNQLLQSRLSIDGFTNDAQLRGHYFATAGVRFDINKKLYFFPSVLLKVITPAPLSVDVNLRFLYDEVFWVGLSYRHKDAIALVTQYTVNNTFEIGYSYDATLTRLRQFSGGTHEIILGWRWVAPRFKSNCPVQYW